MEVQTSQDEELDLLDLLVTLAENWKILIFGPLLAGIAAYGIAAASFLVFCIGTAIAGFYSAYVQSYRFAATDAASADFKARAISSSPTCSCPTRMPSTSFPASRR